MKAREAGQLANWLASEWQIMWGKISCDLGIEFDDATQATEDRPVR